MCLVNLEFHFSRENSYQYRDLKSEIIVLVEVRIVLMKSEIRYLSYIKYTVLLDRRPIERLANLPLNRARLEEQTVSVRKMSHFLSLPPGAEDGYSLSSAKVLAIVLFLLIELII